jgi:hypothetical protein
MALQTMQGPKEKMRVWVNGVVTMVVMMQRLTLGGAGEGLGARWWEKEYMLKKLHGIDVPAMMVVVVVEVIMRAVTEWGEDPSAKAKGCWKPSQIFGQKFGRL